MYPRERNTLIINMRVSIILSLVELLIFLRQIIDEYFQLEDFAIRFLWIRH